MSEQISEERLRNTRAWAAARVGQLSGAEVIVGAIDELLQLRNEVSDLRGFIDGVKPHVLAAAEMYGASVRVTDATSS